MALHSLPDKVVKIILFIFLIIALSYLIFWLWQRQPKQAFETPQTTAAGNQIIQSDENIKTISTNPKDGTVVSSPKINFSINSDPQSYLIIAAQDYESIARADKNGDLKKDIELDPGFNLLKITAISENLQKTQEVEIALFSQSDKVETNAKMVLAGSVKNLFQNIITLNSPSGEKNVKTTTQTKTIIPSLGPTKSPLPKNQDQNVRIGDFLVVLGNEDGKETIAEEIEVYRQSKPQITKQVGIFKLLSLVKKPENFFSTKDEKNNQIIEFTLDKNSEILKDGKILKSNDLQKDMQTIIVYHKDSDKNIPDLIYLLP